ncbi:MAG TPA: restriction endonuclease subunit S, partial [Bacillales bacterium]|nr:restriction endonuclease subunit S [Bacillales bacterium]
MYRNKSLLVQLNLLFSDLNQRLGSLKFKDAFDLSGGYAFKSTEYKDTGIFVLRVTNISEDGTIDKKDAKFITPLNNEDYKDYHLRFGDVLIVMIGGSIGKVGFVDQESLPAFLNQNMWLIRSSKHYSPKYIFYLCLYLCHYHATEKNTSYGFYSRKHFKELAVPNVSSPDSFAIGSILDNIANQKNIELSNLFSQKVIQDIISIQVNSTTINSLKAELHNQEKYVFQLNQAILQEAIAGQLTAEWRTQNPMQKGNPDTDAAALLAKIKAEKKQLIADGKLKKEKPLPEISPDEIPFSLPDSWVWCRLGDLIKESPKNGYSPKAVSYPTNIKTLKLGATTYGKFNPDECKYIDEGIPTDSFLWLKKNDILIQRSNSIDYVGVSAIYDGEDNQFIYPDLMMKIQMMQYLSIKFSYLLLSSPMTRAYFRNLAKGAQKSMPKINQGVVLNTLFPLPPLAEQKAIVEKVDRLMNIIDQLEQQ